MHNELLALLLIVNIVAFLIMGYDKAISANRNARRIPEKTLFTLAFAFGAGGIYLGMLTFRHKTQKWYFQMGIPLLLILNLAILYLLNPDILTLSLAAVL